MKMELTRQQRTDLRRSQIISAALACFTELGYTNTSMADIRRRSGASTGSIYHHFKSKEQLAGAVYLEGIRDYQDGFVHVVKKHKSAKRGVFAMIRFHMSWVDKHPGWSRFLFHMRHANFMSDQEVEFKKLNMRFGGVLFRWVETQVEKGEMKKMPRDLFTSLLLGPCQEFVRQWLEGIAVVDLKTAAETFAKAAWKSMGVEKT